MKLSYCHSENPPPMEFSDFDEDTIPSSINSLLTEKVIGSNNLDPIIELEDSDIVGAVEGMAESEGQEGAAKGSKVKYKDVSEEKH